MNPSGPYICDNANAQTVLQLTERTTSVQMKKRKRKGRTFPADTVGATVQVHVGVDLEVVEVREDGQRVLKNASGELATFERERILFKYRRTRSGYGNSNFRVQFGVGTGRQWDKGTAVPHAEQNLYSTNGRFVRVCGREIELGEFLVKAKAARIWIRGNWQIMMRTLRSRVPEDLNGGIHGEWEIYKHWNAKQAGTECLDAWTDWYIQPNDAIPLCPDLHPDKGFTYTPKPPGCTCKRKRCGVCKSLAEKPAKRFMKWEDMAALCAQHGSNAAKVLRRDPYRMGKNTYRSFKDGPRERKYVKTKILPFAGLDQPETPAVLREHVAPVRRWLQHHRENHDSWIQFGQLDGEEGFEGSVWGAPNPTDRMFADFQASSYNEPGINLQSFIKMVEYAENTVQFRMDPHEVVVTGDVVLGSSGVVVVGCAGATAIVPRMRVIGPSIPRSAVVTKVTPAEEPGGSVRVRMSQIAFASHESVEIRFENCYGTKRKRTYTENRNKPSFLYVGTR